MRLLFLAACPSLTPTLPCVPAHTLLIPPSNLLPFEGPAGDMAGDPAVGTRHGRDVCLAAAAALSPTFTVVGLQNLLDLCIRKAENKEISANIGD